MTLKGKYYPSNNYYSWYYQYLMLIKIVLFLNHIISKLDSCTFKRYFLYNIIEVNAEIPIKPVNKTQYLLSKLVYLSHISTINFMVCK